MTVNMMKAFMLSKNTNYSDGSALRDSEKKNKQNNSE